MDVGFEGKYIYNEHNFYLQFCFLFICSKKLTDDEY